jgi:hypothetical protein
MCRLLAQKPTLFCKLFGHADGVCVDFNRIVEAAGVAGTDGKRMGERVFSGEG